MLKSTHIRMKGSLAFLTWFLKLRRIIRITKFFYARIVVSKINVVVKFDEKFTLSKQDSNLGPSVEESTKVSVRMSV